MKKSKTSLRQLVCAAVALLCLALSFVVATAWQLRVDEFNDAYEETRNLGNVLAGQLSNFLEAIDLLLDETRHSIEPIDASVPSQWRRALATRGIHDLLKDRLTHLPQAFNIAIADSDGQVIVTSAAWPAPVINVADRTYFQNARDSAGDQLVVSEPLKNRINGENTLVFARRLSGAGGEFIGAIYVSVPATYFEFIYESLKSIRDFKFTLIHRNGTILLRYPDTKDHVGDKIPPWSPWYDIVSKGGGLFRSPAFLDGEVRLVSAHVLQRFPLAVSVSTPEQVALARWRDRVLVLAIASLVFLASSLYLLVAVAGKIRSLSNSEAALRQKSEALQSSNMRFDAALNNMSQGLCIFDADERIVVANARFGEIYGLAPEQARPGISVQEVLAGRGADGPPIKLTDSSEVRTLANGRVVSVLCHSMPDGGWVTTHEDITDRQRNEARVAFMAHHDLLTGLGNRAAFTEAIEEAGARLRGNCEAFTVFMLDLDRFKTVNDTLGHPAGDTLLKEAALRLNSLLREGDILARLGGDEFAVVQVGVKGDQRAGATALAKRIVELLEQPYYIDGSRVAVSASIGIALAPEDGDDPNELLKKADIALYRTKAEGRNGFNFFRADMLAEVNARHELENELREAIARRQFELHYQPVVDVRTREICGVEALVRWRHPVRGLVPPDQFIPLAEETGLIIPLGNWILHQACVDAAGWPSHTRVAVNLSPLQLKHSNLVDVLVHELESARLPASRLEVEITESALLNIEVDYLESMRKLKNVGVSIALDDFGTGYSSLSHLTMFPFDKIKIDKWFTQNLTKRADCAAIVSAVLALGSGLDIKTVAEGVETEQQFELLRAAGVNYVQGFLFGRPCPASELDFTVMRKRRAVGSAA